jgi:hypothetical protein
MAIDKDFVIKNGLQVNDDLIYADPSTDKVGIGTTQADKKLVVIGDSEVSKNLTVGESLSAVNANLAGFVTATTGFDIGLDGSTLSADVLNKRIGINSTSPEYTLDVRGPAQSGTNAAYIFGDVEVTGSVTAANFTGQVQGGGDLTLNNLTVNETLTGSDGEVYTLFVVNKPVANDNYRFRDSSNPPAIGFPAVSDNPTIYLSRGQNYRFDVDASGSPFFIKTSPSVDTSNQYNDGVENNGVEVGICTFKVPYNAPNVLYYQSSLLEDGGGKIVLNSDGLTQNSDNVTVSNLLDSQKQADFVNINATGITTLESLKGPNNFSVSAGILTVRQDQTALIGVSTGSDRIGVDTTGVGRKFNITFVESPERESDYKQLYVDKSDLSFAYNPGNNTLFVDKIQTTGTISGVTTGSEKFRVDPSNQNTDFDIPFLGETSSLFRRPFIDSESNTFTFNPNKNTLNVPNIKASQVTAPRLVGLADSATKVAITSDTQFLANNNARILFVSANNPDSSRFDDVFTNKDLKYNRGKGILFAGGFNGIGSTITNLNASNIDRGEVSADYLPDANENAKGVVQLNNTVTSTSTSLAPTANALKFVYTTATGAIPAGTVMLFYQAAVPTGWSRVTESGGVNINDTAIRVVSGAGGGNFEINESRGFTTVFSSGINVPLPQHNHGISNDTHNHGISNDSHSHGINDPGHNHTYPESISIEASATGTGDDNNQPTSSNNQLNTNNANTGIEINNASTGITINNATTGITINNAGVTDATLDFDVNYINVIICSKNPYPTAVS